MVMGLVWSQEEAGSSPVTPIMTLKQFAFLLGVKPQVVAAWEKGMTIQPRHLDLLMRLIFEL